MTDPRTKWLRRRALALATAAMATLLLGTGCGGQRDTAVRIVATDDGFELPATVPSGTRHLRFENRGTAIHEAMLIRLPAAMGVADFVAAVEGGALFPEGALDYSGPGLLSPGESTEQWNRLDPGRYVVFCWNHSKSTHAAGIEVTSESRDEPPPTPDVVVRLLNYRFEVDGTLRRGEQVIRFETPGPAMHEADLFRLLDGRSAHDLAVWRKGDLAGPAPAVALGGVLDSHDIRRVVWMRRSFSPGRYVLFCEMPMSTTATAGDAYGTHADVGMVQELEIAD